MLSVSYILCQESFPHDAPVEPLWVTSWMHSDVTGGCPSQRISSELKNRRYGIHLLVDR